MSRLPVYDDRVVHLAEEGLFLGGEIKAFLTKEERLVHFLGGLDEADKLELAHAQADVDVALVRLRAAKGFLYEVEHRCAQKRAIRNQIVADFAVEAKEVDNISRVIAIDAKAIGVKHIHPELLAGCSPVEKASV